VISFCVKYLFQLYYAIMMDKMNEGTCRIYKYLEDKKAFIQGVASLAVAVDLVHQ
jgi:hypothetical protein